MADVARVAGVSGQTVSRVSNGLTNVDETTRERVVAAMRELGYRPNSAARALRSGRFHNIGITMFSLSSFGNMRILDAMSNAAARSGYSITLIPLEHPRQDDLAGAFNRLSEQAVDGVIAVIETHLLDETAIELPPGLPAVVVDSNAGPNYPVVDNDQAEGARLATEHLLDLGHKTVWHIAGPEGSYSAERRRESWERTLLRRGIDVPPAMIGDWSSEMGYRHGLELAKRPDVTAIFAANDQTALGVLRALHESGRAVPGDVSVVGFDDMDEASSFWPPLTTIRQNFRHIGDAAVAALIRQIEHDGPIRDVLVPISLVVRSSSGPAPKP